MSKIINSERHTPGSIYRIALENFVTYKQVELYPGPSLNMLIGPNGTGKSTFVCAIILGLCGKTSVIGRAKKISEYVRSGCEQATIEIELYQQAEQRNVIITRSFNLKDVSTWAIDHKTVRERQVQELIAGLNIQVDNLCQLLPQDRVQDFSKMDPQQLLQSTLAAVRQDSVAQLEELVRCRGQQRALTTTLQSNAQSLEEQIRLNERLKVTIDAMQERKELERQIEVCEKKKMWIEYQELREKVVEYTADKKEAVKLVNSHKSKMEPLEKVIQKAKTNITQLEQQKLSANREVHGLKDKVKESLEASRAQEFIVRDAENALREALERRAGRRRELADAAMKLDKLRLDRDCLLEKVGDEAHVKLELAELQAPLGRAHAALDALRKQRLQLAYDLDANVAPQIRLYRNKINSLQNVDEKRLEVLREYSADSYQAVLWLRANKHLFEGAVCEPMMLEISFTRAEFARYLEACVPARDLAAFTFESARDMNLFLKKVRQEAGLRRVNAVCSPPGYSVQYGDIQPLRYLGFHSYLVEAVRAPAPVLRYLCRSHNIHRVPLGDAHTYQNSGSVPAHINHFFTDKHRFVVRVSPYSGERVSSVGEVRAARLLANTLDAHADQLAHLSAQLERQEKEAEEHKSKMSDIDNKVSALEATIAGLNTKRKNINEGVEKVRTIGVQIRMQERKVRDIENEPSLDVEKEKEKCRRKRSESVRKQCKLHQELIGMMRSLQEKVLRGHMWKVKLEFSRNAIVQQESELRELKSELHNVQGTLENIESALGRAKSSAKEKLLEAKRACADRLPSDPQFPYREDFEVLPAEPGALARHAADLQARARCLHAGDDQVVAEYEKRARHIARLQADVSDAGDSQRRLDDQLARLRSEWLPPVEEILKRIDKSFGDMFAKLGCAGEIKLEKSGSDEDFDKYGISILVKFRAAEQLQQLTRHAQSGGERALSTAVYLMALQSLATVPFRCVDEINQGMDAVNERKMFQLLVQVTAGGAQYFLLTPKLLSGLQYSEAVTVHTIMNGRRLMDYRRWRCAAFLQRARSYRMA